MTPRDIAETMVIERDVPISMDDGLVIRADVYRPKTQYPVPVIMTSGPYGKAGRSVAIGLLAKPTASHGA
jgi:predicted acyl esterase